MTFFLMSQKLGSYVKRCALQPDHRQIERQTWFLECFLKPIKDRSNINREACNFEICRFERQARK